MDASCCKAEPKCKDPTVCQYYNPGNNIGKVRLGGIYDTKDKGYSNASIASGDEGLHQMDEQMARQREQEQLSQCCEKAKRWSLEFMKGIPGAAPLGEGVNATEGVQAATERIVERFGGLTLGFSGPIPSHADPYYRGLKLSPQHRRPDYPEDLHLKRACRPRSQSDTQRRVWEDEDRQDQVENRMVATFSPAATTTPSMSGGGYSTDNFFMSSTSGTMTAPSTRPPPTGMQKRRTMPISADQLIQKYMKKFNLEIMFEYFLALACLQGQDNPFLFISDVAGRMVQARENEEEFRKLDRIFTAEHISALFRLFDKEQHGHISLSQYKTALETLGLVKYNIRPEGYDADRIKEEVFVEEAMKALDLLLRSFLVVDNSKI